MKKGLFNTYLLPGFIFQSVVIAGAYGTGREIVEFYTSLGPISGLLSILLTMAIWSFISAKTFEFAFNTKSFHYKPFFNALLGKGSVLFEICYFLFIIIILSIIADTCGNVLSTTFNLPYSIGIGFMMLYVSFTVMRGEALLEKLMSAWSAVLYVIYILFLIYATSYGLEHSLYNYAFQSENKPLYDVIISAIKYSGYNLGLVPAVLFVLHHQKNCEQSKAAGVFCGMIATIPAVFIFMAFLPFLPEILSAEFPTSFVLQQLDCRWLEVAFAIMLYGTLMETAAGLLLSIVERVELFSSERIKGFDKKYRFALCFSLLISILFLAKLGIIALVAKGYVIISWLMILVFILPLLYRSVCFKLIPIKRGV